MKNHPECRGAGRTVCRMFCASMVAILPAAALAQWPGWGGPDRNFTSSVKGLSSTWPKDGPKQLWKRDLGVGYSSIAADDGRLYTMYRKDGNEIVVALDAKTGKTLWEHMYPAKMIEAVSTKFGEGPQSTPLVEGGRVYTLGKTGRLECVDAKTGKPIWSHDLVEEYGVKPPEFGFASSPIAYKNSLITVGGGKGYGMLAFDLETGSPLWHKNDFENTYSSPIIINVGGQDQAVVLVDREVVGVSAATGELQWRHPHENQWKTNIGTPLYGSDGLLYVKSGGEAGSRALRLTRKGEKTEVKEIWADKKLGSGQGNVVRIGDHYYGSFGENKAPYMAAINAKTGETVWKERGHVKATMIHADGKLIMLDEKGTLSLAKVGPKGIEIMSKVDKLLEEKAWTVPTLVGKTLYLRDGKSILALDLG